MRFRLLPGQRGEITAVPDLIEGLTFGAFLGDKAYDANALRDRLAANGADAVIPSNRSRAQAIPHDEEIYKWRHLVENYFCKLKEFRGVHTRYDKTETSYQATIYLAALLIALK